MQKSKKQILGVFGLGLVAAVTAVAVALPTPDASAVSSGDVNLKVVVHTENPSLVIQSPSDGDEFTSSQIPISNVYSKVANIHYKLTYVAANGTRTDYNLPDYIASTSGTADGVHSWTLNLNDYGGQYGRYILEASAGVASDYVSFTYKSVDLDDGTGTGGITVDPTTGNPVITVNYSDEVCSLKFQAINKATGATLFNPEYIYTIPTPRPVGNKVSVTLPFDQYKAVAGDYRIVIKAFGCGNNQDDQIGDDIEGDVDDYQPPANEDITKNEDGDPIVKVDYDFSPSEVCLIKFQAINKVTGAALFHPEFKHEVNPPSASGVLNIHLPFAEYGAESGDYLITTTFYDCAGNTLGNQDYDFNGYIKPLVPGVPDTGGGFFSGLNFSRKDYLVTGLVVFMIALLIAIRMMAKNRKSGRR